MKLKFILPLSFALGLVTSCARTQSDVSSVKLDTQALFQVQNANLSKLKEIYLTVSDVNNQNLLHFNIKEPQVIEVLIPRGQERSFQLLALYEKPLFDETELFYGHSSMMVDQSEMSLSLELSNLGSFVPGRVAGRIFNRQEASIGPSGEVVTLLHVNPKLAPLRIEQSTMINGWINLLNVNNANIQGFSYRLLLPTGSISLLGAPKQLQHFASNKDSVTHFLIPRHLRNNNPQESAHYVLGAWNLGGAEREGFSAQTQSLAFTQLKRFDCPSSGEICASNSVLTAPSAASSLADGLSELNSLTQVNNNLTASLETYFVSGAAACTDTNKFTGCLQMSSTQIEGSNDHPDLGDFKMVFRKQRGEANSSECGGTGKPLCQGYRLPGNSLLQLLPGVVAQSVRAYYMPFTLNNIEERSLSCDHLQLIKQGIILSEATIGSGSQLGQISLATTQLDNTAKKVLICGEFNNIQLREPIILSRADLNFPVGNGFSAAHSGFTSSSLATPFGGANITLTLTLKDSNGNALSDAPNSQLNPQIVMNPDSIIGTSQFSVNRDYNNTAKVFSFTLTPTTAGIAMPFHFLIGGQVINNISSQSLPSLTVTARQISTDHTEILLGANNSITTIQAGVNLDVYVRLRAGSQVNDILTQSEYSTYPFELVGSDTAFEFDLISAGIFDSNSQAIKFTVRPKSAGITRFFKISRDSILSSVTSNALNVTPGPVSPSHSIVTLASTSINTNSTVIGTIQWRDQFMNLIDNTTEPSYYFVTTGDSISTNIGAYTSGISTFTTSSTSLGNKVITIKLGGDTVGSPVTYTVSSGS